MWPKVYYVQPSLLQGVRSFKLLAYCWELYADVATTTSTAIYHKEKTMLFNIVIVTVVLDRLINGRPTFTPLSLVFG